MASLVAIYTRVKRNFITIGKAFLARHALRGVNLSASAVIGT
ncbi:hypothetical protein [Bradyrhizobium frederickii]|nr:hypothetical protein [Bradyrhizobium frederickii]